MARGNVGFGWGEASLHQGMGHLLPRRAGAGDIHLKAPWAPMLGGSWCWREPQGPADGLRLWCRCPFCTHRTTPRHTSGEAVTAVLRASLSRVIARCSSMFLLYCWPPWAAPLDRGPTLLSAILAVDFCHTKMAAWSLPDTQHP